ncbi:hypothetical protein N781_11420 [Pontibacillus halophilus JSM 076056 = DSM 19796]|uniref:Antitoxin SocA-like Panacea domain-containing protein n=1 Tax=Pontibacillus halophilus JSM 076056 = DSM 19796 TaxID=1385510 RepID=A0A0A5G5E5_9BACI|nr:type II toxin-antitoxin system antitoxin SocA domain-containing protein [Pontibacillus halophilus]KGX88351.1 hypothetical protein N781_11420 [Pontibacillus halophilus JSM 076056 = DSM 19796]
MTMQNLANHIMAVANENGRSVTNLQLQKVMFFTLGLHIRNNGLDELAHEIYDVPFEKWKYGPVVESIYFNYNRFGSEPIKNANAEQIENYEVLNDYILNLLNVDVFKLVNISHQFDSWADYENEILNMEYVPPYEIEEIYEDFENDDE